MKKIDLGTIKTTTRIKEGVSQTIRLFTMKQKFLIMNEVKNRPNDGETIEDILKLYDISPAVYYTWVRTMEKKKIEKEIMSGLLNQEHIENSDFLKYKMRIEGKSLTDIFLMMESFLKIVKCCVEYDKPLDHVFLQKNDTILVCSNTLDGLEI